MSSWWRAWSGMAADPKWLAIGRRAGVAPGMAFSVAFHLMERAAEAEDRGSFAGYDAEAIGCFLGCETDEVEAVVAALADKGMTAGDRFAAWERRQPKREDDSAERTRAWRSRKADEAVAKAPKNGGMQDEIAAVTHRDAPEAEADTEAEKTAAAAAPPAPATGKAEPAAAAALVDFGEGKDRARKSEKTDEAVDLHRWICERAGAPSGYRDDLGVVRAWLDRGFSASEIRDGVSVVLARQNGQLPTSLRYFDGAIADQRKRKARPMAAPAKAAPEGRVIDWRTADREAWRQPLLMFGRMAREKGSDQRTWPDWARWRPVMGPPPGETECWAPADLVDEALAGTSERRMAGGRR